MSTSSKIVNRDISYTEEYASSQALNVTYQVKVVNSSGDLTAILQEALTDPDLPKYLDQENNFTSLYLMRRTAKFHSKLTKDQQNDRWLVDVVCSFINGAKLRDNFVLFFSSSTNQQETEKDFFGQQIIVSHQFPNDYVENPDYAGKLIPQGGKVQVLKPQIEAHVVGLAETNTPQNVCVKWQNRLNSTPWIGGFARGWMCMSAQSEPIDVDAVPQKHRFRFTFQFNFDGWDPTVIFTDPNTGKPPADLVPGVGFYTVTSYPELDYNTEFPLFDET